MPIERFDGKYAFLSNFYPVVITYEKIKYPTVEHAYQAAKTDEKSLRLAIAALDTPGKAKRKGQKLRINVEEWDEKKIEVMQKLVRRKFKHPELAKLLIATYPKKLIEGNWWGDRFWGVCRGEGQNQLGRILMKVRRQLRRMK